MHRRVNRSSLSLFLILAWCVSLIVCIQLLTSAQSHAEEPLQSVSMRQSTECADSASLKLGSSFTQAVLSGGLQRTYRVHLPAGYQAGREYPLVMSFHGHGSNAAEQERRTGFSQLADQQGFIAVYPQGLVGSDHLTGWATGPKQDPQVDDVRFVSDLLGALETSFCVDPQRLYASGFSNGGAMTNLLACDLTNRFAAFAPVSGSYTPVKGGCHPQRPVPILAIHGTGDTVVPYTGNVAKAYPPITMWLDNWAKLDDCQHGPQVFYTRKNVLGEQWTGCQGAGALLHYRIAQGTHEWPSETSQGGLRATQVVWAFFQMHSLRT